MERYGSQGVREAGRQGAVLVKADEPTTTGEPTASDANVAE